MQRLRVLAARKIRITLRPELRIKLCITKEIFERLDKAARRHNLVVASKTQDVLTQLIQSALNVYMQEVCKQPFYPQVLAVTRRFSECTVCV
jgi:hypothetical protein